MPDTRFGNFLIVVNGIVPLALLGWDAYHNQLGADRVMFAIHTTGMMALIFLCLTLAVTPARNLTGMKWLFPFRRTLGLYAFFYACLHFLIYFAYQRDWDPASTFNEIIQRKYLMLGATGLALMIPLAITSTKGIIHRMGSRRWLALHRLVYVAAVAGVIHYYLHSKVAEPLEKAFVAVVCVLLGYRLAARYVRRKPAGAKPHVLPVA